MKKHFIFFIGLMIIVLAGCGPTITQLQKIDVTGPPNRNVIRITENRKPYDLEFRTQLSFNQEKTYQSQIEGDFEGNDQVPISDTENFFFHPGGFQGMIDFDFALSSHFAVTGGLNIANINGSQFWGKNIGIGIFNEMDEVSWRFDYNIKYQKMKYRADITMIMNPGPGQTEEHFIVSDKEEHWNGTLMFTLNSKKQDWYLNYFFNACFGNQTFYDFEIGNPLISQLIDNDPDFDYTETYMAISAGVYKNIMDSGRLILGLRYTMYNDKSEKIAIPDFFVQYDFKLF